MPALDHVSKTPSVEAAQIETHQCEGHALREDALQSLEPLLHYMLACCVCLAASHHDNDPQEDPDQCVARVGTSLQLALQITRIQVCNAWAAYRQLTVLYAKAFYVCDSLKNCSAQSCSSQVQQAAESETIDTCHHTKKA